MSDIAIKVEGLSKQYRIGEQERYKALRDVITDAATSPFRRLRSAFRNGNGASPSALSPLPSSDAFWALKDVSFEVSRGEVVGIIGRNGAGKSTLLKILSRITKPTKGHATINGRVGSLLEVGTGFHPELTGRENIYLNAAILGMRKAEVAKKFDEIVAFAEVEKFIDTPVKRYSSGMYVRLAFAVAAHMETEVLLVDEVLAVGDAEFQKKCLGKMKDVASVGRTVLFVTHNMQMIDVMCTRCVLLEQGRLSANGEAKAITELYLRSAGEPIKQIFDDDHRTDFSFLSASSTNEQDEIVSWINEGEDIQLNCEFRVRQKLPGVEIGIQCRAGNRKDVIFASVISDCNANGSAVFEPGTYSATLKIDGNSLFPGVYSFSFFAHIPYLVWFEERTEAIRLTVKPIGLTDVRKYARNQSGFFKVGANWTVRGATTQDVKIATKR